MVRTRLTWLGLLILASLLAGCSTTAAPIDPASLPPEQQEIVKQAERFLGSSRLEFQSPLQILSIEKTTSAKARQRMAVQGSTIYTPAGKNQVWLVMLGGSMRIVPPDPLHTLTPDPFTRQCVYVMIDSETHMNALSSVKCPDR